MRELTVLHSVPSWLPLTATWLFNQVRYLPSEIRSHIVCENTQHLEQFDIPGIHALENASWARFYVDKIARRLGLRHHLGLLVEVARSTGADVLHSHFGNVGWDNLRAPRRFNGKHVVTFYGKDVNYLPAKDPVWRDRYLELFGLADAFLCEGPHMAECLVQLGCPREKVHVQHLGIEVDRIRFEPRRWTPPEPFRVLIAASFREKKGIPYAIAALGEMQKKLGRLEITIIGDASDDPRSQPEKLKILGMIEKYGLGDRTRLLGYQSHERLFREAYQHHLFLSPSVTAADGDTEGGAPVTIIEMAATGLPIVSTTHCDIPSVILNGVTGLLAAERDVAGLVEKIGWLVEHPDAWNPMLKAGREHVEAEYNVVVQAARLGQRYRMMCNSTPDRPGTSSSP